MNRTLIALALASTALFSCDEDTVAPVTKEVESFDLSRYVGSEGGKTGKTPGVLGFASHDGHLFVPLQRLGSDWKPLDTSLVLEIDPVSRKVVREIKLPLANPYAMKLVGGTLYLACVGAWSDDAYENVLDGGVVSVDLAKGTSEIVVRETTLGGNVSDVQAIGSKVYVAVSTTWPSTHVAVVEGGRVTDTVGGIQLAGGLQTNGSQLLVGVRETTPFVALVDTASDSATAKISTGIEPTNMDLLESGKLAILGTNYTVKLGAMMVADSARKGARASTRKSFETSNLGMTVLGDVVYVLNRDLGVVTGFRDGDRDQVVLDWNVGSQSNPYDLAIVSGEIWVACYNLTELRIRKP
jgi:hypothetical protein